MGGAAIRSKGYGESRPSGGYPYKWMCTEKSRGDHLSKLLYSSYPVSGVISQLLEAKVVGMAQSYLAPGGLGLIAI